MQTNWNARRPTFAKPAIEAIAANGQSMRKLFRTAYQPSFFHFGAARFAWSESAWCEAML
jgi:hypothetical protein